MKPDDLDRWLNSEEIVPSSGFAAAVVEAVRQEASSPAALAFPLRRALPGFFAMALALTAAGFTFLVYGAPTGLIPSGRLEPAAWVVMAVGTRAEVGWMTFAMLLAVVPAIVSLRFVGRPD